MAAVAYIRRSHSGEAQASEQLQRETVARLASERGEAISHVFRDWGRSGGSETRPEYLAMLAQAEAGAVSTIYAYDQDRLARSAWLFMGLLRLADQHGLRIITSAGDITDDDRRDFAEMRGVMDGGELRKITKRNRANLERMKARGDDFGVAPFGYEKRREDGTRRVVIVKTDPEGIQHVLDTYRAKGTFLATARALNEEGFTTHRGKQWHPTQVRQVLIREAPNLMPGGVRRGTRGPGKPRYLAGLLRCFCGSIMTPGGNPAKPRYYCAASARGGHPLPHGISERKLLPRIKEEAARLRAPDDVVVEGDAYDDSAERSALRALRGKVSDAVIDAGLAELDTKRSEHGEWQERLEQMPGPIEWETDPVDAINDVLQYLWAHVQLGPDLLPLADGFEWRVPQWRAAD